MLAALLLAAFAVMALPSSADARVYAKDINLQVTNNGKKPVHFAFCPNGHVNVAYQVHRVSNPCNVTPYSTTLQPGQSVKNYTANPVGVVMTYNGQVAYFYASNPLIGKPFFEVNGNKVPMVEGELQTRHPLGMTIRLHRGGDTDKKNMIIEVVTAP